MYKKIMDGNFFGEKNVIVSYTLPEQKWTSPIFLFNQFLVLLFLQPSPTVFLAMQDACGLRPCDWTYLKKRPCAIHTRLVGAWEIPSHLLFRHLPANGGLGLLPGTWGAPFKGNADGAEDIFGNAGRVLTNGPVTGPILKRPCVIFVRCRDG